MLRGVTPGAYSTILKTVASLSLVLTWRNAASDESSLSAGKPCVLQMTRDVRDH